jgi:hypothetical protein
MTLSCSSDNPRWPRESAALRAVGATSVRAATVARACDRGGRSIAADSESCSEPRWMRFRVLTKSVFSRRPHNPQDPPRPLALPPLKLACVKVPLCPRLPVPESPGLEPKSGCGGVACCCRGEGGFGGRHALLRRGYDSCFGSSGREGGGSGMGSRWALGVREQTTVSRPGVRSRTTPVPPGRDPPARHRARFINLWTTLHRRPVASSRTARSGSA